MKKLFFFLFTFFVSAGLWAQEQAEFEITWGEAMDNSEAGGILRIIGDESDSFYALGVRVNRTPGQGIMKLSLRSYNYDMKMLIEQDIDLGSGKEFREFLDVISTNTELLVFSSFQNKRERKNYLFAQHFNKSTLKQEGDLEMVMELDYTRGTNSNTGQFDIKLSNDRSKTMIMANLPYKKRENEKLKCYVYDAEFKPIMQRNITLPHTDDKYSVLDYEVSNQGQVYILGKFTEGRVQRSSKKLPDYKFEIISYSGGESSTSYPVTVAGKYVVDTKLIINLDQDLICAGFFTEKSGQSVRGSYFLKIDHKTGGKVVEKFTDFDIELITQNMSKGKKKAALKKDASGKVVEIPDYRVAGFILKEDGGLVLIGEQRYSYYRYKVYANGTQSRGGTIYRFNSIMVLNIAPTGEIEWSDQIEKEQVGGGMGGLMELVSFGLHTQDDRLHIFYNDNSSRLAKKKKKVKTKDRLPMMDAMAFMVSYNMEGKRINTVLNTYKDLKMWMLAKATYGLDNGEAIMIYSGRTKQQLGMIKVKD